MPSIECGVRNAECGIAGKGRSLHDTYPYTPHSALHIPHWLVGALLASTLTTPVSAQQSDSTPKDTTLLAPVVVTGVRLPTVRELARGLAGRTAALSAQDLDARGVRSLADALEQLPGVTTSDELGATGQLDVSLRGFQVSPVIGLPQGVTVYVDGVRANEPDAHEVNFDLLPLEDVERVEVVYGPSVLLGRNALGAAVNLVTRRGTNPASRELEASAGSYGRYELKAHVGARHGVWDYYLGARYEREAGWRQDTQSRIATLFGKIGLLNGTWDATLSYSGADNRIFQAGSLPESLAAARPDSNFTRGDYFAPQAHLVILNAQRLLGRTQLAINAFGRSLNSEQFNVNFVGENSRQLNRTRIGGGAVQLSGRAHLGGRELRWLAGADADYQRTAVRILAIPGGGGPDSLTESVRTNQVDAGAFLGGNLDVVPRLTATLAARYDWIRVPFEDLVDPSQSGLNIFRRLSPRAGLTWSAGRGHEMSASASRGFRAPAVVEIGCADSLAACPLPFALGPDPALPATTRAPNGETSEPGDALPLVPNHRVNAGAALPVFTLSSGPSLRAALDARYVGRQWLRGDEANATGRLSDYAVADASLTLGWRELELRAMVRNVLDHRYFNFGTFAENPTEPGTPVQRWLTPGVPRSVQVSLSTDF